MAGCISLVRPTTVASPSNSSEPTPTRFLPTFRESGHAGRVSTQRCVVYRGAVPDDPPRFELAQVNIGRLLAPVESAEIADFMAALDPINRLADASPGFIWRLQTEAGNATSIHSFDDDLIISNMSVWDSIESLRAFVYTSAHVAVMGRRREWFERYATAYMALWWVPSGHRPTIDEAKERLALLDREGPTPNAFTFRVPFDAPLAGMDLAAQL
jgi:Domain of unknown function (DUF3291)